MQSNLNILFDYTNKPESDVRICSLAKPYENVFFVFPGQGQTKASKRRESNGEQGPSPKKEAKKSPKKARSSKSPRTSRTPSSESPVKGQGHMQIEEREGSPSRLQGRRSQSPPTKTTHDIPVNGKEIVSEDISAKIDSKQVVGSPPKPKRTYEVEFVEPEKENVPVDELDSLDVSDIRKVDSSLQSPVKMNGLESQVLTPARVTNLNTAPQATSTPAPNGILTTGRGRHSSGGPSKYFLFSCMKLYSKKTQLY